MLSKILELNKENIKSIPFDGYFEDLTKNYELIPGFEKEAIYKDDDIFKFFQKPGENHYRLLSYLSSLFNDSLIIDIGTHTGQSSLALSYNESNTIYTFDIFDKVYNEKIKSRKNIIFFQDDLFETKVQEKWKNHILNSAFIFLDVDPHNGNMEIEFYNYLKEIDYKGFVVCDDIWYFKEMRDNFWYKIPDKFRYDLSDLGDRKSTV
jgi:predicted O-methyltransferase YrrM